MLIESRHYPGAFWEITPSHTCTCPSFRYRKTCVHFTRFRTFILNFPSFQKDHSSYILRNEWFKSKFPSEK